MSYVVVSLMGNGIAKQTSSRPQPPFNFCSFSLKLFTKQAVNVSSSNVPPRYNSVAEKLLSKISIKSEVKVYNRSGASTVIFKMQAQRTTRARQNSLN